MRQKNSSRGKGILFILLAAFFFSMMSVFVRLSGNVPTMQKAFFRNIVAAFVAAVLLVRSGEKIAIRKESLSSLFMRSIFGTAGILANFWAVDHLGIADANMLNKLSPFFAILMSVFILKEIPNRIEWLSVLLAFIGAAFVAKPSTGIISIPALVGIFGGFAAGTAYTFVRKLGLQGVRGPLVVTFFSSFSTLVLLPNLIMNYQPMTSRPRGSLSACCWRAAPPRAVSFPSRLPTSMLRRGIFLSLTIPRSFTQLRSDFYCLGRSRMSGASSGM